MKKTTKQNLGALALAVTAFAAWIGVINSHSTHGEESPTAIKLSAQASPNWALRTAMSRMVNCEDFDIQPCYTWDEGKWMVVYSYAPYKAVRAYDCKEEDGVAKGQKYPCVWKQDNKKPKGHKSDPTTRNVFWKGISVK